MMPSLAVAAALCAAAGCTGSKELTCAADQQVCSDACVSLQTDGHNCGACGRACGAGQGCFAGACVDCTANPAACTAAVAVACFDTDEVRFVADDLTPVGAPLSAPSAISLARVAGTFYVADDLTSQVTPFTLAPLQAGQPIQVQSPSSSDLSHVVAHEGLLWASNSAAGTLVVVDPATSKIAAEVPLAERAGEYVNPQGIDFVGTKGYLALQAVGAVAVLDVSAPTAPQPLKRIDVSRYATAPAAASPTRVLAATNGKVYVTLNDVADASWKQVPGANGKLVVIDPVTDTVVGDTALDLGPDCLNASAMAQAGTTLWIACGYYDFVDVWGGGLLPVAIGGATPAPGAVVRTQRASDGRPLALDALALCGGAGYAGAVDSGTVLRFDPSTGAVAGSSVVCPAGQYGSYVPDLACVR
jgi:hypothetical protein